MNDDEKDDRIDAPESIFDNNAAPAGGDSFSIGEIENNDQELAQLIEAAPDDPIAANNPYNQISVRDSDDDPPDWPDF